MSFTGSKSKSTSASQPHRTTRSHSPDDTRPVLSDGVQEIIDNYKNFFSFEELFINEKDLTYMMRYDTDISTIEANLISDNKTFLKTDYDKTEFLKKLAKLIFDNKSKFHNYKKVDNSEPAQYYYNNETVIENTINSFFHRNISRNKKPLINNILDKIYDELYQDYQEYSFDDVNYTIKHYIHDDAYNKYLTHLEQLPDEIKVAVSKRINLLIQDATTPHWLINLGFHRIASEICEISEKGNLKLKIEIAEYNTLPSDIQKMYESKGDNYMLKTTIEGELFKDVEEKYKKLYKKCTLRNCWNLII